MKSYKPTSPSRRGMTNPDYKQLLSGNRPHKALVKGGKRDMGRNSFGRITTRHKGGGNKKLQRDVDFVYNKKNIEAKVESIEFDPNRTGFIALVCYRDGERRYILAPKSVKVGDTIIASETARVKPGNRLPLSKIPVGTFVYNVEIKPGNGAKMVRSAGNYAEVSAQDGDYTLIKMPSTEVRRFLGTAWASVGEVSNDEHHLAVVGKAGRSRHKGIRPTVRGTVMNPVDHPHGGGEGKAGRGHRRARSMWGKPTGKGHKTRTPKKYSNYLIVSRRKVGKKNK